MHKLLTLLTTLMVLSFATPAGTAAHCTTWSTAEPEVTTTGAEGAVHYIDNDVVIGISFWVYEESNGIEGLQRGDEVVDNTCHGLIEADTIIL